MTTTKDYKGPAMEGLIANWYSRLTLKDINRHQLIAAKMVANIPPGGSVLEIAPGPGYFCLELAKLGDFHITGLDISKTFVEIATRNARAAGQAIDFRQGSASDLPFSVASFDFTFCQAAFKNFSQPVRAIAEMYRVLRPGGTSVIVDMRRDASPIEIKTELKGMHLGRLDEWMTAITFKGLVRNAYGVSEISSMISQTPFGAGRIEVAGLGFTVWLKKPL